MKDFRDLKVWLKAHQLVLEIYHATRRFPSSELYGLTSQLKRSSSSIPANIAEGCGRGTNRDFARCLQIAMGSASEVEYHLLLACDLDLLSDETYDELNCRIVEVKRMLSRLILKARAEPC